MDVRVGSAADDAAGEGIETRSEYVFTLKLAVEDATALWSMAADRCVGLTSDEISDTIGPREDPSIEDCLAMVTVPDAIAGCRMIDVGLRKSLRSEVGPIARTGDRITHSLPFSLHLDAQHLGGASGLSGDDTQTGLVWRS